MADAAHLLRLELAAARSQGLGFASAWPAGTAVALRAVSERKERQDWDVALTATRSAWADGYERSGKRPGVLALEGMGG